jgi:cullin 1
VSVESVWAAMGAKLDLMLTSFAEGRTEDRLLDRAEWMRMYTDVYNICVHQDYAPDLYERLRTLLLEHLAAQREAILPHRGEDLMRQYCQRFDSCVKATNYIRRITMYMHRFWIPLQKDDGPPDANVLELDVLVLVGWEAEVLRQLDQLLPTLFDLIDQAREGDQVDWDTLSGVIKSFAAMGRANQEGSAHELYTTFFEDEFLRRAHDFYQKAATEFLANNTVPDYMRKVEEWLHEEEERADQSQSCQRHTKPKLQEICTRVLIDDFKDDYIEEFVGLVKSDARDDLRTMYKLLSRSSASSAPAATSASAASASAAMPQASSSSSSNLLKIVSKKLEALIVEEGQKLIDARNQMVARDAKNKDQMKKCLPLIKHLTTLHGKYKNLVETCFSASNSFVRRLYPSRSSSHACAVLL